ncbi:hypothetical protein SBOR_6569 [Sclerotinia borealis F-4128]|uniref:DUF5672 domain-containing protein n=1 Tax=Sclerotinia borealis (strain F-4128) TaxID=1432307 RepID=W9CB53_SCLBF|nr:hypothetical protein SBOR_6569 [Sclerotinia borealis F-4128]
MSSSPNGGMTIEDIWDTTRSTTMVAWSNTTRRMRVVGGVFLFFILSILLLRPSIPERPSLPTIPKLTLDYGAPPPSQYNASKVALIIENRVNPILSPLMLHFMSVVPPDWRFRFMGSLESVAHMNTSRAIRQHVQSGKLDLTYIPANMTTGSQEEISRFLTNLWLYETVLQPAEWLLLVGLRLGRSTMESQWQIWGNGGLSLRRVSAIIEVLRNQVREDNSEAEDVWLTDRLGHRPGSKLANGTASLTFSGEMHSGQGERVAAERKKAKGKDGKAGGLIKGVDDWRDGFYEPMGYHTGGSGVTLHAGIWGTPEMRKHIWDYCPEVKMTIRMDAAKYVPGDCNSNWKRWDMGQEGVKRRDENVEIIDGVEYPMWPASLVPW